MTDSSARPHPIHASTDALTSSDPMMKPPQELLDEIFGHLPWDRGPTLKSCPLVSESWLGSSRRGFFNVALDSKSYRSWLQNIPSENSGILCHVHSFSYPPQGLGTPRPRCHDPYLHGFLPALRQLRKLDLSNMDIEPTIPGHLDLFSAFQHALSSPPLSRVSIAWSFFTALSAIFPT